jgi:hypothetical protein
MRNTTDLIARLRDWSDGPDTDKLCQDAAAALEAQAAQIEALRADAARYRWLRDEDDDPICSLTQLFTMTGKPEDVDTAVDAAMRKAVTP